ncbi:hypothetical protein A2U01_0055322 [Trifolium medium]|uniref:Uncharacterized protein n=1 Tax=Trifolium medium TaxID=97028 RepID=A0A392RDK0_9FABA|nr:hypothetical protein [Trifolium medium]
MSLGGGVGWIAQLVELVELRVNELEVNDSSPGKEKNCRW